MDELSDNQSTSEFVDTENVNQQASSGPKFSFKFTKQTKSNVVKTANDEVEAGEEITCMQNGLINGQEKPKKKEPVISRTKQQNDWRVERLQAVVNEGTATDEQKALLALLTEGLQQPLASSSDNNQLELKPQNGPVEAEDVEPDYDQISFSDFGAAFLRGRGWKKGEGIGRTNKRVVPLVVHAKGKTFDLGLTKKKKEKQEDSDEPEIPLGAGVAVKVLYGTLEGKYGRVKSMDSSSGRCDVEMPDKTMHEILDKLLQTMSDKEYIEKTKVINKVEVDKYEKKNDKSNGLSNRLERRLSISEQKVNDDDEIQILESSSRASPPWTVTDLLVRLVDKKYKEGRYYKEKMLVVDAPSINHIELKDDRRRIHTVSQSSIETVIPRGTGGQVMLLKGRQKGRVGTVIKRDDRNYELHVRVLGIKDVVKVDFDDACEYRGNVEDMEYD